MPHAPLRCAGGGASRVARAISLAVLATLALPAAAQGLDDLRDEQRRRLHDVQFAAGFAGLLLVSDEVELSGTVLDVDDGFGTTFSSLALPFHSTLHPWSRPGLGLHVEGVVGRGRARQSTSDLYGGVVPGLETSVKADWDSYGGLVGAGPSFEIAKGLVVAPIVNLGLSRVASDAVYGGPGAEFTASLFDGIGLNWRAWVVTWGGAARLKWMVPLGRGFGFEAMTRYDLRWSTSFAATDTAQEFASRLQAVTVRADVTGPTGLKPFQAPLSWRLLVGSRRLLEGDVLGVRDVVQVGGALELNVAGRVWQLRSMRLGATLMLGPDVSGWSLGGGGSF